MGNFREHLKNGLAKLILHTASCNIEPIKATIPNHLHITFDNMKWSDISEDEKTKVCKLVFDFGDLTCEYQITFTKRVVGESTSYILSKIE